MAVGIPICFEKKKIVFPFKRQWDEFVYGHLTVIAILQIIIEHLWCRGKLKEYILSEGS